jgi:hypothetical protein
MSPNSITDKGLGDFTNFLGCFLKIVGPYFLAFPAGIPGFILV